MIYRSWASNHSRQSSSQEYGDHDHSLEETFPSDLISGALAEATAAETAPFRKPHLKLVTHCHLFQQANRRHICIIVLDAGID